MAAAAQRVGLIVNPVAGMGGRVALKGTDGPEALEVARRLGAAPVAGLRARRAVARLAADGPILELLVAPGLMGSDVAAAAGVACRPVGGALDLAGSSRDDTQRCARALAAEGVELLLFAGGDGTARDILDAIGDQLPLVGVPTGVKMHSGVFAATPDAAGRAAAAYLHAPGASALVAVDVADVDEAAARRGRVSTRLYGSARVPRQPALMVAAKAPSSPAADRGLDGLCREIATGLAPGTTLVVGPGTTTARVLHHAGLEGTLLGVDALRGGAVVGRDLSEAELLDLLDRAPDASLLLGVVGGQGSLLGRGNQPLSARVLRRLGPDRITVVAAADKLLALDPPMLRVDTGDDELDATLSGHRRVLVASGRAMIMPVST